MKIKASSIYILVLVVLISCSEKEEIKINQPPIAGIRLTEDLNKFNLDGSLSTDPDGATLTYKWSASSDKIIITAPLNQKTYFLTPLVTAPIDVEITLKVSDGSKTSMSTQIAHITPLSQITAYGLGKTLAKEVSENTNYEWYLDQANSGTYALVNCGPASVTMAIKWSKNNFSGTPEDARKKYRSGGGWWYTDDVVNYLKDYNVPNYIIRLSDINLLKKEVDGGNIIILCLDMFYVEYQADNSFHFSKFYQTNGTGWGHFIVVKGYKEVDGQTFFETYDPYSFSKTYTDNSLKGKDRYYKSGNLDQATGIWWDYAIVISKVGFNGGRIKHVDTVDPETIVHKSGQ